MGDLSTVFTDQHTSTYKERKLWFIICCRPHVFNCNDLTYNISLICEKEGLRYSILFCTLSSRSAVVACDKVEAAFAGTQICQPRSRSKTKMSKMWVWKADGCDFTGLSVSHRQNKQMCFQNKHFTQTFISSRHKGPFEICFCLFITRAMDSPYGCVCL